MSELTAIDILLNPDDTALAHARRINATMRRSVPDGFALDATHAPHVTTLQRFVHTAELGTVYDAVDATIAATDHGALSLRAEAIRHQEGWGAPGQALAAIVLTPSPGVLDFQSRLLDAVTPYTEPTGTAAAFVTDAADPEINQTTIDWVQGYVPNQIGDKYIAHITVGLATVADLKEIESEPFEPFDVQPAGIAVYHLGNHGTARTQLRSWTLTD